MALESDFILLFPEQLWEKNNCKAITNFLSQLLAYLMWRQV